MWIPLQLISPKFSLLLNDLKKCKSVEERRKLLDESKTNWKYDWMAEEIKKFFEERKRNQWDLTPTN